VHKKHGIKLAESKTEPVLLVQTRVPGRVGKSQNKGKGMGRTNVDTWKGKCQLGFTQLVSKSPNILKQSQSSSSWLFYKANLNSTVKENWTIAMPPLNSDDSLVLKSMCKQADYWHAWHMEDMLNSNLKSAAWYLQWYTN